MLQSDCSLALGLIVYDQYSAVVTEEEQQQQHYDLSKEIMTIKAQLLAVVNRLDYVEKLYDDEEAAASGASTL